MAEADAGNAKGEGKKKCSKLVLITAPVLLLMIGVGLFAPGIVPYFLSHAPERYAKNEARLPVFVDLPKIVANLGPSSRQPTFIKLTARLEFTKAAGQAAVVAAMRILGLLQTHLRETRPEGLHAELISSTSLVTMTAHSTDVLFTQVFVQ